MGPKRKQYNREQRLRSAKKWLETYAGKNIFKGYRQHYGVDWKTAFTELEMLGVNVDAEYKKRVLESIESQAAARRRKSEERLAEFEGSLSEFQDDNFAFIVGYTSGGAPYGITWEDWDTLDENEDDK